MACLTVHERRDRTAGGGAARERHIWRRVLVLYIFDAYSLI